MDFIRHVVTGDTDEVTRPLMRKPSLAATPLDVGATRQDAESYLIASTNRLSGSRLSSSTISG